MRIRAERDAAAVFEVAARRRKAPLAVALEARVREVLDGPAALRLTHGERERFELVIVGCGGCGYMGNGDISADAAREFNAELDALEKGGL